MSLKKGVWSGVGSGSVSQRNGSADPDPHQTVTDPQHSSLHTHLKPGFHLHLGHEDAAPEPRVHDHLAEVGAGGLQGGQRGHVQPAHDQADHLLRQVQDRAPGGGGRGRSTGGQGCGSTHSIGSVDPYPEGQKEPTKVDIFFQSSCFEVLNGLFWELKASSVTWTFFMEA